MFSSVIRVYFTVKYDVVDCMLGVSAVKSLGIVTRILQYPDSGLPGLSRYSMV